MGLCSLELDASFIVWQTGANTNANLCPDGIFESTSAVFADNYRYGFNGQEKDDEVKGQGNSYDFGARIYDSRLGRWLSIDPMSSKFPSESPYNFGGNNPIFFVDTDGEVKTTYRVYIDNKGKATVIKTVDKKGVVNRLVHVLQRNNNGFISQVQKIPYDAIEVYVKNEQTGDNNYYIMYDGARTLTRTIEDYFNGLKPGGIAMSSKSGEGGARAGEGDGQILNIDELMPLLAKAVGVNAPAGGNAKKALETIRNYVDIFESIDALIESLDNIEFNQNPTSFEVEQFDKLKPEKSVTTGTTIAIKSKYTYKSGAVTYPLKVNIPIQDSAKEVDKIINNSNSKLISVEKK